MKKLHFAIVGSLVPGSVMLVETVQTGKILFWTDPARMVADLSPTAPTRSNGEARGAQAPSGFA